MATYTTSRGRTYEFSFEHQSDGSIRPYIVRQPSYGSRDSGCHATHRLHDNATGRPYICWDKKLTSVQDAAKVAAGWAARTDVYIDTGVWKS